MRRSPGPDSVSFEWFDIVGIGMAWQERDQLLMCGGCWGALGI